MAITRQAAPVIATAISGTTVTQSFTVNAGTDSVLVVRSTQEDGGTHNLASVTFNGVALTELISRRATTWSGAEIWILKVPPVTTANVVATWSAAGRHGISIMVLDGVDQTTTNRTPNGTNANTGTSASITVAGVTTGDYVVDLLSIDGSGHSAVAGADQTSSGLIFLGSGSNEGQGSAQDGANGGVMSWTWTGSNPWSLVAVAFIPAASGSLTNITIPAGLTLTPQLDDFAIRPKAVAAGVTLTPQLDEIAKHPKALSAGLTLTAVLNRRLDRLLALTLSGNPVLSKQTKLYRAISAGITFTNAILFPAIRPRSISAGVTLTAAFVLTKARALPLTVTLTAALVRTAKHFQTLPVTVTLTAAIQKMIPRTLAATLSANPVISGMHKIYKTIAATLTVGQVLAFNKSKFITLPATVTMGLALLRQGKYYKTLAAGLTLTPVIVRQQKLNKTLAANLTLTAQAQLLRTGKISLNANLPLSIAVVKVVNKTLNSVVNLAGVVQAQKVTGNLTPITLAAGLQMQTGLVKVAVIKKAISGALFLDSVLNKFKLPPHTPGEGDWLIDAKSLDTPHLDGAQLEEPVLERTML